MKYHLIVKPEAELDILEAARWYEQQQSGLGKRFIEAVDDKMSMVEENPLHLSRKIQKNTSCFGEEIHICHSFYCG